MPTIERKDLGASVVHPGERSLDLDERISSLALRDLDALVRERRL